MCGGVCGVGVGGGGLVLGGVGVRVRGVDVAACFAWTLELPAHVNIDSMVVRPRAQASNTLVARKQ